ncbi:efflux transporter outer membrane subunit [Glaciimonas sp. PCH181]|uniref:efflux transporter outer membrane subunit n=1 Tax=Glaciimonas sp. PCH181 TaxID=2133943 RepID=UPI000D357100|nr:efflux transporter outer membrane subunit [Glaciimonas sp. PCH181]PUA20670.1 RND transporter [Glaciimonas sp. PCH181]
MSAAVLALSTFIAGCATGPNYQKPSDTDLSALHNAKMLNARQTAAPMPALDSWWTGFHDPVLTGIIEHVLKQNLDLAAAIARVDQARAIATGTAAQRLPQGNLISDATRAKQSLQSPLGKIASTFPGYERTQTFYDVGAGASWELDLFGSLKRGSEAANAEEEAAEADHLGVRISVAAEAADAYFRIRGAQARIALAENQVKTNNRLLELVGIRLNDGLSTVREQAQAEARLSEARASIPPLRTELERQSNRLDVLMGAQPGTYATELVKAPNTAVIPATAVADSPTAFLRRRPDVIAAERRLAASNANIGVAMAEYYPKLSLSGLLGFGSLGAAGLLSQNSFQPAVGLGLRWRIFDFGRIDAEIARAKGVNSEALLMYRLSMLRATEDVENTIMTLAQLEVQSRELVREVDAHQRARDASEEAYKGGAVSLTEVLDEDRLLLTGQDQLAQAHADNARAAVTTFRALGGGW